MIHRHTKYEVSTITCNEEMKGNAKCKNFHFDPHFGIYGSVESALLTSY